MTLVNPIDFFNILFRYMKLDYEIPYINLDNVYGMNYLKDYIKAKEIDDRIKKVNHTLIYSFINKFDGIITGLNVSTSNFSNVIEQEKKRMLIRK